MAQIKISELSELEQVDNNDVLPIVDVSEGETYKAKVGTLTAKNIELIAVTDTEPTTFSTDDKYYNTEDKLIYTALNSSTWSSTGVVPKEGILYVVFGDQSTYAYNGTTLVSVGGGSGSSDIIIIGDESEATEDTKLVVDTTGTTDTLKYKDNNSFTELQIKALDSMPVGTIVEFNGQVSDIPSGWEETTDPNSYSTSEVKTNKTWIDGKPIYRKVLSFTTEVQQDVWFYVAHNISNVSEFTNISSLLVKFGNGWYPAPNDVLIETYATATSFAYYNRAAGFAEKPATVILEYTKTTD